MQVDPVPAPLPHAEAYGAYLPHSLGGSGRCSLDGAEMGCAFVESLRSSGATEDCPDNDCSKRAATVILTFKDGHKKTFSGFVDPFLAPYNGATTVVGRPGHWGGEMFYGRILDGESFQDAYKSALFWSAAALFSPTIDRSYYAEPQKAGFIAQIIRSDIGAAQARLKGDKGCRDFLNQLLASVQPRGATFIDGQKLELSGHWVSNDIFDALNEMSGASFKETGESGVREDGSLETINDLRTVPGSRSVQVNDSYISQSPEARMFAVIHESLHMFSGFTDQALAAAARQIFGDKAKVYSNDPAGTEQASKDLNYYIEHRCTGLKSGNGTTFRLGE